MDQHTHLHRDRNRDTCIEIHKCRYRKTQGHTSVQAERQTRKKTDEETHTVSRTHIHTYRQTHTHRQADTQAHKMSATEYGNRYDLFIFKSLIKNLKEQKHAEAAVRKLLPAHTLTFLQGLTPTECNEPLLLSSFPAINKTNQIYD